VKKVCAKLHERHRVGKRFSIIVVAEGARPKKGKMTVRKIVEGSPDKIRLGGVAYQLADTIEKMTGLETRATVLGHLQRGGSPTPYDRNLATRFGNEALELVVRNRFGRMVALKGDDIIDVPIEKAVSERKLVPPRHPLIKAALAFGTAFGD
jgi:6-phosphofructokinase 1